MERGYNFSQPQETFQITPLGAAIVEALPDRRKVRAINRRFETEHRCPVSRVFNAEQLVAYYRQLGVSVEAADAAEEE